VIDQRTDVFGLGLVLFEMLEGHQFFHRMELAEVLHWVWDPAMSPPRLTVSTHAAVERLAVRALARDPADRFPTMAEMSVEIERCLRLIDGSGSIASDSAGLSDEQLQEAIARLERERLRRQAQQAQARLEAAQHRADTVGAERIDPDAVRRALRFQEKGGSSSIGACTTARSSLSRTR
jgi:serine/threonine protein kinase